MDVGVVTPRYPPVSSGGGERSAQLLARNLARSDRISSATVLSFDGTGRSTSDGVAVRRLGDISPTVTELQNVSALRRLRPLVHRFDVVHSYNMELHPVVGFLSSRQDVPSVATLNSYHFFPASVTNTSPTSLQRLYELVGHPTTGRILRYWMKRIDVFVALSRAIQRIYEENGFDGAKFEHVTNMIDPAFDPPERDGSGSDGYALLYVGSLTENKGVGYLVRAMASLPEEYRLRVVGDGPERGSLESLADELGVAGRVDFSGQVPYERIGEAYAAADVFVHPGIWPEPLNRTVLEAMQAGLPVVCTDVGGPPEVIPDDRLLCRPADPDGVADAVQRATSIDGVGERNRQYVEANHSPAVVVDRIVDVYEELASAA